MITLSAAIPTTPAIAALDSSHPAERGLIQMASAEISESAIAAAAATTSA
jgi:hypothetical protein